MTLEKLFGASATSFIRSWRNKALGSDDDTDDAGGGAGAAGAAAGAGSDGFFRFCAEAVSAMMARRQSRMVFFMILNVQI